MNVQCCIWQCFLFPPDGEVFVRRLIEYGADTTATGPDETDALDWVKRISNTRSKKFMTELLVKHGVKPIQRPA